MLTILLIIAFGVLFSVFATQNTEVVNLNFGQFILPDVPIYLVVLSAIAIGILIVGLYYLIHYLSVSMTMGDNEKQIKNYKKEITSLTKEVHKLELENTKLKTKYNEDDFDEDSM